ncbi:nucleoside triphosphate pyrophosphohydrolase [Ferrimonas balearica]|uniref:nucleoside triphosphate pyrophosphohydrolase n=1 Tax=Ferrimonas balearica TaxID=44012 RepID=UPI001C9A0949|nr:nucleoside triphosphate pyrophosphohydrolase [Ferrimonas balearica]MBY5921482.1 nucleoside triphosphate pyrophosphohydrolase [Ferrimonas balearica]MBY5995833.1 nucleoside triphosphate pyrophosphohydrolase [Ferrimonas balearica]
MSTSLPDAPIDRLLAIMAALRHPETGCPWDRKQTLATIVPHTLEEAYEVADAIERSDLDELPGELGDLLFQVVFYARIAEEAGQFDFLEVVNRLNAKLVQRHPHVFAGLDADEVTIKANWEAGKAQERAEKAQHSALDNVPLNLPALSRSAKLQKRVARVGFDWDSLGPVVDKIVEEIDEVMDEAHQAVQDQDRLEEEMGDLLFAVTNLSRHLKVDPEQALRKANTKFERRFRQVENLCAESGLAVDSAGLEQLEAFWQQVKAGEKR